MTIGERIKQRRQELNMSQDELAQKVGYKSRSSINKIELSRDLPLNKVEKMATALDTTPGYLMGWQSNPGPVVHANTSNRGRLLDIDIENAEEEYYRNQLLKAYQKEIELLPYKTMIEKDYIRELLDAVKDYDEGQIVKLIEWISALKRR